MALSGLKLSQEKTEMAHSLSSETHAVVRRFLESLSDEDRILADRSLAELADHEIKSLPVGELAPDFELPNIHGYRVALKDRLQQGPVVLSFFRGGWCSFCNLELRALQRRLPQIEALGASLLALSPQKAEYSAEVSERHHLRYDILEDARCKVAHQYGLVLDSGPDVQAFDERFGVDLTRQNADGDRSLPLPATFIVGLDHRIIAAHVTPDWTRRMEPDEVVRILREMA